MAELTLIPNALAKVGYRFFFMGDPKVMECEGCPVRTMCFRIKPGRHYEVISAREVEHPCELHQGGLVTVCEVKEVPFVSSVKATDLRGTATHWQPIACGRPDCKQFGFCHPVGPAKGAKMEILDEQGPMECPAGLEIRKVKLQPMDS